MVSIAGGDPVCTTLSVLVNRDLMDAGMHPTENVGWTPLTILFAQRLRELQQQHGIWSEEPDIIRLVLDGTWD